MNTPSRPHLFGVLAGLFLATGLTLAAFILANTWTRLAESSYVNVTGSARRNIRSDLAIWTARFSTDAATLLEAQEKLKADLKKTEAWLAQKQAGAVHIHAVQIREINSDRTEQNEDSLTRRIGYRLTQQIEVHSADVDRVPKLAGEATDLLEQGVAFITDRIDFIYTKASDAKIEMMAEATKDARSRADQIAGQGNRRIKELRSAHMGVVQINPMHSTATSWQGNNDTSTLEKTITATVTASFSLQ